MNLRLVSADAVKEIICKYESRLVQHRMILEIEKLPGCIASRKQEAAILGNEDVEFKE